MMKLLSIFLFGLFAIKSCGSQPDKPKAPSGTYTLITLAEIQIIKNKPTIIFDTIKQSISGFSGCNRFFASYSIVNKTIKFDKIGSTRMLCEEKANQIETEFLQSLEKITSFSLENKTIKLYTDENLIIEASQETVKADDITIEYVASARGSYQKITVKKGTVLVSEKRGGNPVSKVCSDQNWKSIFTALKSINLETLPELEAPSKDFQFDGAPITRLKVISNDKTYETQAFDHGNPPQEIETLVKEILSLSENIE